MTSLRSLIGARASQFQPLTSEFGSRTIIFIWLLSRLWTAFFVYLGHVSRPFLEPVTGGWEGVRQWLLNPWTTYDSLHFMHIAQHGYEPVTTAFFPLYPSLLRFAGSDEISITLWGVALSNAAFLVALFLFYELTKLDYDERTARLATMLLAFFPAGAFFSAVYTESLFLMLIVGCFLMLRRGSWMGAGLFAMLAALTRNSGLILSLALFSEGFRRKKSADGLSKSRVFNLHASVAALPLLAFIGVQAYFAMRFGSLAGVRSQGSYLRATHPNWPWEPVWLDLVDVFTGRAIDLNTLLNLATTIAPFVFIVLYRRRQPLSYTILLLGIIFMHLTLMRTVPPYTIGSLRYMATTFPFTQLLALCCLRLTTTRWRMIFTLSSYALICALMSYMFGTKSFGG